MNSLKLLKAAGLMLYMMGSACLGEAMSKDLDLLSIRRRMLEDFLPGPGQEGPSEKIVKSAKAHLKSLGKDGAWADINYTQQIRSAWNASTHISRIYAMAKAYRIKGGALFKDPDLKLGIQKSLEAWYTKNPQNENYWWNAIGIPNSLGPALLLMEQDLSKEQLARGIEILKRGHHKGFWDYHGPATGQNLIWLCNIHVYRGVLERNPAEVERPMKRIAREIVLTAKEGIQADYSFHQHGAILYAGGYGLGFGVDCARLAYLVHGTRFALPEEKIKILSAYILDGQQWMVRGPCFDYGAIAREIARQEIDRKGVQLARASRYMAKLPGPRQAEFAAMTARLENGSFGVDSSLEGNRHFRRSDFMVHRRKGFYFSIKMFSKRTVGTESGNGENEKGRYLADGCTYLLKRGDEYAGIFPVWNWRRIPGITCEQSPGPIQPVPWGRGAEGLTSFVGGVSDGTYGAAAFDFKRKTISARKAWFCFDREIVCLGAGIASTGPHPVVTSVNQCLLKGVVKTSNGDLAKEKAKAKSALVLKGPLWVHHDGVGYLFPEEAKVSLQIGAKSGAWKTINFAASAENVTHDVFDLGVQHGKASKGGAYRYIVVPAIQPGQMDAYEKAGTVEVLENTPALQAVRHKGLKIVQAVFYRAGHLKLEEGPSIKVNQACLVMVRDTEVDRKVVVAKPDAGKGSEKVRIEMDGKAKTLTLPLSTATLGASISRAW